MNLDFMFGKGFLWAEDVELSDWLTLESLRMEIPDLTFPFDAGGGVERFQNTRCQVREIELAIDETALASRLNDAAESLGEFHDVRVQFLEDAIHVSLQLRAFGSDTHLSFRAALLPPEPPRSDELHLSLYDYRWFGPMPYPGRLLAYEWMTGVLNTPLFSARGEGRPFQVGVAGDIASFRPFKLLLVDLFPPHGWKLPNLAGVVLDDIRIQPGQLIIRATSQDERWESEAEPIHELRSTREGRRALAAYESKDLFAPADEALFAGHLDEALELLSNYREKYGLHPQLASRILDCLLADPTASHLAEAESICDDLVADNPDDLRSHLARPVMTMARRGDREALFYFEELSSLLKKRGDTPDWALAELAAADILEDEAPEEAADRLRDILKALPKSLPVLERLRSLYQRLGNQDGLEAILKRLTGVYSDREQLRDTYLELARHLMHREGEVGEARHYLQKALNIDSEHLEALETLGESYTLSGKPMRAVKALSSAARIAESRDELPRARALQFQIAGLWRDDLGEPEQALLSVRRAISTTETELDAASSLARPQAIEYARQLEFAAELCQELDRPDEALGHWSEAVSLLQRLVDADDVPTRTVGHETSPDANSPLGRLAKAHRELGRLYVERGRTSAAESHWRRVLELDPDARDVVAKLEAYYKKAGRAEDLLELLGERLEAADDLARAANYHRKIADIQEVLGDEHAAETHRDEARDMADRIDVDQPDNPWRHDIQTDPVVESLDRRDDDVEAIDVGRSSDDRPADRDTSSDRAAATGQRPVDDEPTDIPGTDGGEPIPAGGFDDDRQVGDKPSDPLATSAAGIDAEPTSGGEPPNRHRSPSAGSDTVDDDPADTPDTDRDSAVGDEPTADDASGADEPIDSRDTTRGAPVVGEPVEDDDLIDGATDTDPNDTSFDRDSRETIDSGVVAAAQSSIPSADGRLGGNPGSPDGGSSDPANSDVPSSGDPEDPADTNLDAILEKATGGDDSSDGEADAPEEPAGDTERATEAGDTDEQRESSGFELPSLDVDPESSGFGTTDDEPPPSQHPTRQLARSSSTATDNDREAEEADTGDATGQEASGSLPRPPEAEAEQSGPPNSGPELETFRSEYRDLLTGEADGADPDDEAFDVSSPNSTDDAPDPDDTSSGRELEIPEPGDDAASDGDTAADDDATDDDSSEAPSLESEAFKERLKEAVAQRDEDPEAASGGARTVQASTSPSPEQRIQKARSAGDDERLADVLDEVLGARDRDASQELISDRRALELRRELAELYYYDLEETEAAKPHLEILRQRDPGGLGAEPEILRALEATYQREGNLDGRISILRAQLEQADDDESAATYCMLIAQVCWSGKDDADEAERLLEQTLEYDPDHQGAHRLLADVHASRDDYRTAADHLSTALQLAGDGLDALELERELADLLLDNLDDPRSAADHYTAILEETPGDDRALEGLQTCYRQLDDWEGYLETLRREIAVELGHSERVTFDDIADLDPKLLGEPGRMTASQIVSEAADICRDRLDARERAWRLYGAAIDLWDEHFEALDKRVELDRTLDKRESLAEDLDVYADGLLDAADRFEALREAAELFDKLDDPERASDLARRALEAADRSDTTPDGLEGLRALTDEGTDDDTEQ
jgi:tetratricopeptide (TPR) repeat protein